MMKNLSYFFCAGLLCCVPSLAMVTPDVLPSFQELIKGVSQESRATGCPWFCCTGQSVLQKKSQLSKERNLAEDKHYNCFFELCNYCARCRAAFSRHIINDHRIPYAIRRFAQGWNLSTLRVLDARFANKILVGLQDGNPVHLKLGFESASLIREAALLKHFNGVGCIPLLGYAQVTDHDRQCGALLTPWLDTKKTVSMGNRVDALAIAATVIRSLQQNQAFAGNIFPSLSDCLCSFVRPGDSDEPERVKARAIRDQLLKTAPQKVLLHGNLNFNNIIQYGNTWVAVDPIGVVGDPTYETNCFILDALHQSSDPQVFLKSVELLLTVFHDNLGFNKKRMLAWSYVAAVSCACWEEDLGCDPAERLRIAHVIELLIAHCS